VGNQNNLKIFSDYMVEHGLLSNALPLQGLFADDDGAK
jgi:hypothetical protein